MTLPAQSRRPIVTADAAAAALFADIRPAHRANAKLRQLGEDVTKELEYKPGRFVVNRIVRLRMADNLCEKKMLLITLLKVPMKPFDSVSVVRN